MPAAALAGTSAAFEWRLCVSVKTLARFSYGSNCFMVVSCGLQIMICPIGATNIILAQVLDAPPIFAWQLHDIPLQPPFGSITRNRLASTSGRLVVCADPRRKARIGHLSGDIAIYRGNKLVVEMFPLATWGKENVVDTFRVLGLVEAA